MRARRWETRSRLALLETRVAPGRRVSEAAACPVCRTVLVFATDALGRVVEACRCGERAVERRAAPAVEDGRRHRRRNGVNPSARGEQ